MTEPGPLAILLVTHQLPPQEIGGVGSFTVNLAAALRAAGHLVTLLAGTETRLDRPGGRVVSARRGARVEELPDAAPGVRTLRLVRAPDTATALSRFWSSFLSRDAEALVEDLVDRLRPDVLHVQHTLNLSARVGEIGRARGAAVVATVHDYWPLCQRIDLRHADGSLCDGPRGGMRCAACLPPLDGLEARNPAAAWSAARQHARRLLEVSLRAGPYVLRTHLVQGAYASAHRLTCPAPSVAERLVRAGFDRRTLAVVDYGIPLLPPGVASFPRPRAPVRFGFLGTLGEHKGLRVALRAAELCEGAVRLEVYGGPLRDPALRELLHPDPPQRLEYHGPYTAEDLPGILTHLDALIIPSLWPETGPMVWMEAMAAGLPVIASRIGALEERVRHGVDGLLVPPGDAEALAQAMRQAAAEYPRLREGALARQVRTVDQAAVELLAVYRAALAGTGSPARGGWLRRMARRR